MNFAISWVLSLFKKPEVEITFEQAEREPWPFPVSKKEKKTTVPKATTRSKKPVAKKTTTVAKKKTVKKAK